jgi:hypothetical protein
VGDRRGRPLPLSIYHRQRNQVNPPLIEDYELKLPVRVSGRRSLNGLGWQIIKAFVSTVFEVEPFIMSDILYIKIVEDMFDMAGQIFPLCNQHHQIYNTMMYDGRMKSER